VSIAIPRGLDWMRDDPRAAPWLAELPGTVERCASRWGLDLGEPYAGSHVSWVAPASLPGGGAAVLKVQLPDRDSEHEAEALRAWDGDGAVRLLGADTVEHALLLERAEPGDHLSTRPTAEALQVLAVLLPRLWVPAAQPFRSLAEQAAAWAVELPGQWERAGRPFDQALLREALDSIDRLTQTQGESVLLHQDLHADNVVRATREPWLVIDPKPLAGERAFGLAPVVRSYELGHSRADVVHRLDLLSACLDVDRERARGWALAQTVAWSFDGAQVLRRHVETATWLAAS
jgi:streptomycin 6-kinase